MIKIGASDVDTIKIGSTDVDTVMLGGVEIYSVIEPPDEDPCEGEPITSGFLQHYTNPEYDNMDAFTKTRLYPMGGTMPINYWGYPVSESTSFNKGQKPSDIDLLAANGFTAYGNNFGNNHDEATNAAAEYAGLAGLRHICNCYGGSNTSNFQSFCDSGQFDNGPLEQAVIDRVGGHVADYVAEPRWNDYVDAWFVTPEETAQRMDTQASSCGRTAAGRFLKNVRLRVNAEDPQNRPIFNTELEATTTSQYQFVNRYREPFSVQTYKPIGFHSGSESVSGFYPAAITQTDAGRVKDAVNGQTYDPAVPIIEKPFGYPLIGPYYGFENISNTAENFKAYTGFIVTTHMAQNAKGFGFYGWHILRDRNHVDLPSSDLEASREGCISFVKMFTDANFHNACLWGKNMKGQAEGVGVSWTGPQNANFYYDAESLTYYDKQLGNCRYLGFSNSHWSDTCGVTMTGLPVGENITNIKTGDSSEITNSTMQFNVAREDWEMFKVFSGTPPEPDTNLPWSSVPSEIQTWADGVTSSTTLNQVDVADARWSNRSNGEAYAYESANYLMFYFPNATAFCNFNMVSGQVDWHDPTPNCGGPITVGASQSVSWNSTGEGAVIYDRLQGCP